MTNLSDMSVPEAASKALELIIFGQFESAKNPTSSWRTPYEGTFEQYLANYYTDEYGENESTTLNTDHVWQELKYEGGTGVRDGWSGKVVDSFGGEGEGDQYWMVISVSDGETTRYFRRDGWYASYDGGYLDGDTYEVSPREKTITVYE